MVSSIAAHKSREPGKPAVWRGRAARVALALVLLATGSTVGCGQSEQESKPEGQPLIVFEGFDDVTSPGAKGGAPAAVGSGAPNVQAGASLALPVEDKASAQRPAPVRDPAEIGDEEGIDLDAVEPEIAGPAAAIKTAARTPSVSPSPAAVNLAPGAGDGDAPRIVVEGPHLGATKIATTIYKKPHTIAQKLGYLRLGGLVRRDPEPTPGSGCSGPWYRVYPEGYICTDDATTNLDAPLVRATQVRPALDKPLPYAYGFVRATAPQYLRLPSKAEQMKSEFKLDEHLQWYRDNYREVQRVELGANDVPLAPNGAARLGVHPGSSFRLSSQLSVTELLGGRSPEGVVPFWLRSGRQIPNVSAFDVPEYAVFADRVRRKTGLSFVDAFIAQDEDVSRRFAVTVDMRLIPATKIKPDTASPFHGVEINEATPLPFAIVNRRSARTYRLIKGRDEAREDAETPRRAVVPLTGKARIKAGQRYYQIARMPTRWLRAEDVGVVAAPPSYPPEADAGQKWIDVSLVQQTLVLYEGRKPVYATLVSTGRDRLGDPKTSLATPQGTFRIQSKHIAAAMDSEENSSVSGGTKTGQHLNLSGDAAATTARLLAAEKAGTKLSADDEMRLKNVKRGRHPEYGVTMRRGSGAYELRDVPWIQYFAAGYALHGAYWHDVFGVPRSHGCINLAPVDARYVFMWTEPQVPAGWHGFNVSEEFGQGTLVRVRE